MGKVLGITVHNSDIMDSVRFCFLSTMRPNSSDISFNLFGFPTIIQPFFWLIALLLSALYAGGINDNMPFWLASVFVGAAGILLSILVHELGHAFTFRHLIRTPCVIVLHGFGGMAIPEHHRRSPGFFGAIVQCFLAFSGPLAGFILAFVAFTVLQSVPVNPAPATILFRYFLELVVWISVIWGIFNLLPIYPMDGGHIAREVFIFLFPRRGIEFSLILSMMIAAFLIAIALQHGAIFIAFVFVFFIYQNYQEWSARTFR